jgi:hypothetical protein
MKNLVNISVSDRYYDREPEQKLGTDIVLSNF